MASTSRAQNVSEFTKKRKRNVLSLNDKLEIAERMEHGESPKELAEEFEVAVTTIYDIKRHSGRISDFVSTIDSQIDHTIRKTTKRYFDENLDRAVYEWYLQKRSLGERVKSPDLCKKAVHYNKLLKGNPLFKGSTGWLKNFKLRHRISLMDGKGGKREDDFRRRFLCLVEKEGFTGDNIYNVDEMGLQWKSLPWASQETSERNQRLSVVTCANATGTHKLPLFLIGNAVSQKSLRAITDLPVNYNSNIKSCMNQELFLQWYKTVFIKEVTQKHENEGVSAKVLLVIDIAPCHPSEALLFHVNPNFRVIFMPQNVAPFLQPMEQSIIKTFKLLYRKHFLQGLLLLEEKEEDNDDIQVLAEKINIRDCCKMCVEAWSEVSRSTMVRSWKDLWPLGESDAHEACCIKKTESEIFELAKSISLLTTAPMLQKSDLTEWLTSDKWYPGYDDDVPVKEEEDVVLVKEEDEVLIKEEDELLINEEEFITEEEDGDEGVSNAEALKCCDKLIKWFQEQDDYSLPNLMSLNQIRDLAFRKMDR